MHNVGSLDRIFRFVVGAALLVAPFMPPLAGYFAGWGLWKLALAAAGIVMVATAAFRVCPAYTLLGIRTCEVKRT